jgi:hypothetical protein
MQTMDYVNNDLRSSFRVWRFAGKRPSTKDDAAASTTVKADDKAYTATLKSLPNKPFDPWSGTR